jgi:uroporphyrin-3 C-methyltransferase
VGEGSAGGVAAGFEPPPGAPQAADFAPATPAASGPRWLVPVLLAGAAVAVAAAGFAWNTQQRVKALEAELVKRQQDLGSDAAEARLLARQAQEAARDAAAKVALLEARVAESAMQRSQFEDLIGSLARSRDENVLADVDAAVRVAMQQTAITGSAEPLVVALRQADERLARWNQPRLERVRRAVAQDLERARGVGVSDIGVLTLRLDDVVRMVDELPLLATIDRRTPSRRAAAADAGGPAEATGAAGTSASAAKPPEGWRAVWAATGDVVWQEVRSLVRVTRIEQPEAMLIAPEQAFFLRENLKLRLLNARLALLSRQFETAQLDLRDAATALDRYFDRGSRRVVAAGELVRQVAAQARQVSVPRPDATLAAVAAAAAGR